MNKGLAFGIGGGLALLALPMSIPAQVAPQQAASVTVPVSLPAMSVGRFTPAVRNARLAAELARRSNVTAFQFTPAVTAPEQNRAVRIAVRAQPSMIVPQRARPVTPGTAAVVAAPVGVGITPSTYNLGVAVGLRRFALTGEVSSANNGGTIGSRETTVVGAEYHANRRVTGRVAVAAERAEGVQRITGDDRAYSLDVAGSYSIARGVAVTGGVRYRVSRDRLEPLARDERRDSQAVYFGTAIRF